jgi:hypothetical protein
MSLFKMFWGFKKPGTDVGAHFTRFTNVSFISILSRLDQTEKLDIPFLFR